MSSPLSCSYHLILIRIQEIAKNLQKILECKDADEISDMELTMTWCAQGGGVNPVWFTLGCFAYAYAWIDIVTTTGVIVRAWRVYAFVHVRSNLRVVIAACYSPRGVCAGRTSRTVRQ